MDELTGTQLGRYRVGRLLGSGGMGAVYAGIQEPLGRPVAIKVLRPEISTNANVVARFQREAELAASLSHPNIAQVTDFGVEDGRAFLVMDLLEGESLAQLLEHEPRLSEARAQRITMQVLTALAMAHDRGVVHRDLKPENVFVQRVSGMELIKLLDFGIAHMVDVDHSMTNTGAVLGTPAYMSPEQARGRKVDARSDVFSLGAVLYQMLAGVRPFEKDNYHELMFAVVEEQPPALTEITPALAALIERAMNKTPETRFASATEMRDALGAIVGLPERLPTGAITATRDGSQGAFAPTMASDPAAPVVPMPAPIASPVAPAKRSRGVLLGAVSMVVVFIVALGGWAALDRDPPPPPAHPVMEVDGGRPMQPIAAAAPRFTPVIVPPAPATAPASDVAPDPDSDSDPDPTQPVTAPTPRTAPRARAITMRCGASGDEVELPIIGPRDHVYAASIAGVGDMHGVSTSQIRGALSPHAGAITRCYRGHPLLRGQDYTLATDAEGRVQRVEARTYCPIDPPVVSCMERALTEVVVPDTASAITFRIGLSLRDR